MSTPLLDNIAHQPHALQQVADRQFGSGRAALEQAAALLRSKGRVVFSGMGASLFACQAIPHELARLGMDAAAVDAAELLYFTPAIVDAETAVVVVSRSGESVEITRLLPMLRARGAAVIAVVNTPQSTLARNADIALVVGSPADQMVAIQTYTGTAALFALLAAAVSGEWEAARSEWTQAAAFIESFLSRHLHARSAWDELLENSSPLYILGRGPSLGSVNEGVLLMHETAKAPAVGMSVAQFRHGPVEVVDKRFRAVVLGTRAATASLDRTLVEDLASMGAQALLIDAAGVPERFLPVVEVLPLQLAAYRKAELRGVTPGEFRWAPQITTSEAGFGVTA